MQKPSRLRLPQRKVLIGGAIIVRQVDVGQFRAESVKVFVPPVVASLQCGVAAVQMKAKQRHVGQKFGDHFELVAASKRDSFQHDSHADMSSLLARWPEDFDMPLNGLLVGKEFGLLKWTFIIQAPIRCDIFNALLNSLRQAYRMLANGDTSGK